VENTNFVSLLHGLFNIIHRVVIAGRIVLLISNLEVRCSTGDCDFEPQPDYYVALLWSRLMGTIVLDPPKGNDQENDIVHFHAHCTAGGSGGSITLAFSNLSPNISFILPTSHWGENRTEYILQAHISKTSTNSDDDGDTSADDRLTARQLELNGKMLRVGSSSELPSLTGRLVLNHPGNPWVIGPITLGFVVFPEAKASVCMRLEEA
jgi:hypothetical protein